MGFMKRWDAADIAWQLNSCASQMNYRGNDGFVQWDCKKDLIQVKYQLEKLLRDSPTFGLVEESFIEDMEKQQAWEILKDEKTN